MKQSESKAHPKDGERAKIIRCLNDETQAEFAAKIGVSEGTVLNHEKGYSEMPLHTSREIFKKYALNPTPINPEEDPRLLLRGVFATFPYDDIKRPRSLCEQVVEFRKRASTFQNEICSPFRRFVEAAVNVMFSIAAIVVGIEQLLRAFPNGGNDPGFARDVVFVGSFCMMIILFVPIILNIPWGIKTAPAQKF
jgi:DNA-binding XRE family transcriptional regulator